MERGERGSKKRARERERERVRERTGQRAPFIVGPYLAVAR